MENTNENKMKFFALYFGQNVFTDSMDMNASGLDVFRESWINGITANLKPLSSITDEDALECAKTLYPFEEVKSMTLDRQSRLLKMEIKIKGRHKKHEFIHDIWVYTRTADYLRSRGYALQWMGLSVEKQVEYGWIKLI